MAGVKGIFQVFASCLRQGERRNPADYSGRRIRLPGKLRPGRKYGRPHLPAGKFTPQESPQDKPGEGKFPSGGCARPSLCSKSLRPGLRPHDRKPTPPAGSQMEALRPGPDTRRADTALSHKETCSARLRVQCMCPPPTGKRLLRFPAGKAAAFSPCLREENKKKPCRRTKCALKLQGFKRRKAPETGAFPKITLASAYFPT